MKSLTVTLSFLSSPLPSHILSLPVAVNNTPPAGEDRETQAPHVHFSAAKQRQIERFECYKFFNSIYHIWVCLHCVALLRIVLTGGHFGSITPTFHLAGDAKVINKPQEVMTEGRDKTQTQMCFHPTALCCVVDAGILPHTMGDYVDGH